MLPEPLNGEWTPDRLDRICQQLRAGQDEGVMQVCALLNSLNNMTQIRINDLKIVSAAPTIVKLQFGDGSTISLTSAEGVTFLKGYILDRDRYIAVMQYNRTGDPRVTGELNTLKERVAFLEQQLEKRGQ